MTLIEEFEEVVRLWIESPDFAKEAHKEFKRKLELVLNSSLLLSCLERHGLYNWEGHRAALNEFYGDED